MFILHGKFYQNMFKIFRKTVITAQLNKCKDLLNKKSDDIVIHALGNAITRALILALMLENSLKNSVKLEVITSTVNVI